MTKLLSPLLHPIVTSLSFSSHNRFGLPTSGKDLKRYVAEFLIWMKASGDWQAVGDAWSADDEGPWSLPFVLLRSYLRYRQQLFPSVNERHANGVIDDIHLIASPIMDAFVHLSHRLPDPYRLSYQLHLEGLLNEEIESLLKLPTGTSQKHIDEAKELLFTDDMRKASNE